ncbi:MAG: hypothetical protein U5S82_16560 [Gammaproteobacteria bacterium]|nr:hypothetical protein [Gammaproteobacteria bacterium]
MTCPPRGVLDIELLPPFRARDVVHRLEALLLASDSLRDSIAYWTIEQDLLGPDLARCLTGPQGFICVDIHRPTHIDFLADLRSRGAAVYLHLFDLAGNTEAPGIKGLPPFLLHSKVMLFDLKDGRSVLWVGSHNATQRALLGINIETSLLVTLERSAPLYSDAAHYLESIRSSCDLVELHLVDYYKWLQGLDGAANVIELEDDSGATLEKTRITILGDQLRDYTSLKQVDASLFVAITDSVTAKERFYQSTISETGKLESSARSRGATTFGERRWAFRSGMSLPLLQPTSAIPAKFYGRSKYFVTIALGELLPEDTIAKEPTGSNRWRDYEDEEEATERLKQPFTGKKGDRRPRIRKAVPPDAVKYDVLELEDRKRMKNHELVRRRVIQRG